MIENQKIRPAKVIGPLGEPLTLETLPPADTTRWVVRRKAEVVAAVNGGLLSVDEVCDRYNLTVEEFAGWQRAIDRSGMPGLRVTRIQHYRASTSVSRNTDAPPRFKTGAEHIFPLKSRNPETDRIGSRRIGGLRCTGFF